MRRRRRFGLLLGLFEVEGLVEEAGEEAAG
jgi:hypothetical protein